MKNDLKPKKTTLHEAIEMVLKEHGQPLTSRQIADSINQKRSYLRQDGEPISASQITARCNKYPAWFIKIGNLIGIKRSDKPIVNK